jgi:hypothetical protein
VTLGGVTVTAKLRRGAPQGGVASPILGWNLTFDRLLEGFDFSPTDATGFADDGGLITIGVDYNTVRQKAQAALNQAMTWAAKHGLELCKKKTVVILFTRKKLPKGKTYRKIKMGRSPLTYSTSVKYLGVIIDHKLTWKLHIKTKMAKAKRLLMLARHSLAQTWGPSPKMAKWAYTGIVRPGLSYGSVVWNSVCQNRGIIDKLRQVQRLGLLQIAHVRKSTPTVGLEMVYNVEPLDLFIRGKAAESLARIHQRIDWVPKYTSVRSTGHRRLARKLIPRIVQEYYHDEIIPIKCWEKNYEVIISLEGDDCTFSGLHAYTDGSLKDGHAGAGESCTMKAKRKYNLGRST